MQIITEVATLVAQPVVPSRHHCQGRLMSLIANANLGIQSLARYAQRGLTFQTVPAIPVRWVVTVQSVHFQRSLVRLDFTAPTPLLWWSVQTVPTAQPIQLRSLLVLQAPTVSPQ